MEQLKKYVITTDSTTDLPDDYIKENNLTVLPVYYSIDGNLYRGTQDQSPKEFYSIMRSGKMPTTMAVNMNDIRTAFEKHLKQGLDILHIAFSSALSGTYSNTAVIARELLEEYPDRKIIVIDSMGASMGEGLLVHYALEHQKAGESIDEVADWVENNKLHLCHQFTVDDLHCLQRGGRISKSVAVLGTLINVKPVLHVDDTGHLVSLANVRGRKKALISLVNNMEAQYKGYRNDVVFISHGDSIEDAEFVRDLIKDRFGLENFLINNISPAIGSHAGPGTIALFFMGEKR